MSPTLQIFRHADGYKISAVKSHQHKHSSWANFFAAKSHASVSYVIKVMFL